ncbi:MAG: hypothetical protein A3H94_01565 [Acidobacteria bacterium RIFCSPLOWO2_02_FULL_60_20]|nr:MAG: hypothetical protein A3H94_01565 [Acidobacteria bacterium RIFCSPLOWO2_02_FULL_60_20]
MNELANQFSAIFRDEHRAVRDGLLELTESFKKRDQVKVVALLGQVATLTGPHFRYEEESLYPALVESFGQKYIDKLFADHDRLIGSAGRLVQLAGKDAWNDGEVDEAVELVRDMLPHVSDCDGLSIMVERLPEEKLRTILDARQRCNEAGLDLLRWAREVRKRPTPSAN